MTLNEHIIPLNGPTEVKSSQIDLMVLLWLYFSKRCLFVAYQVTAGTVRVGNILVWVDFAQWNNSE